MLLSRILKKYNRSTIVAKIIVFYTLVVSIINIALNIVEFNEKTIIYTSLHLVLTIIVFILILKKEYMESFFILPLAVISVFIFYNNGIHAIIIFILTILYYILLQFDTYYDRKYISKETRKLELFLEPYKLDRVRARKQQKERIKELKRQEKENKQLIALNKKTIARIAKIGSKEVEHERLKKLSIELETEKAAIAREKQKEKEHIKLLKEHEIERKRVIALHKKTRTKLSKIGSKEIKQERLKKLALKQEEVNMAIIREKEKVNYRIKKQKEHDEYMLDIALRQEQVRKEQAFIIRNIKTYTPTKYRHIGEKLQYLDYLYNKNLVTKEEYQQKRKQLLLQL